MHRKPKLLEAARHLQQVFESTEGSLTYAKALDVLTQLEGFEGYRQVRALLGDEALKGKRNTLSRKGRRTEIRQSLARFIFGHGGYTDGRKINLRQHTTLAMRTAKVEYMSWMAIPPRANMLWVEDSEGLRVAADWDAGERYEMGLRDDDVLIRYEDAFGVHRFTWKDVRTAEHVEGPVWRIAGREYELLSLSPAEAPQACIPYEAKPGEFLTREQTLELRQELQTLEAADSPAHAGRIDELRAMLANSLWMGDATNDEAAGSYELPF